MANWRGDSFRCPDGTGELARTLLVGRLARANSASNCCFPIILRRDLAVGCHCNAGRPRGKDRLRCDVARSRRRSGRRPPFGGWRRRHRHADAGHGAASALSGRGFFLSRGDRGSGDDLRCRFTPRHSGQPRVQPDEFSAGDSDCRCGGHGWRRVHTRPVRRAGRDRLALPGRAAEALGRLWGAEPHRHLRARLWLDAARSRGRQQDISRRADGERWRLARAWRSGRFQRQKLDGIRGHDPRFGD